MDFLKKLEHYSKEGKLSRDIADNLHNFYHSYSEAVKHNNGKIADFEPILIQFLDLIVDQLQSPFSFSPYHQSIRTPFDYYQFGLEFIRPIAKMDRSSIEGIESIEEIVSHLAQGDNVIFLSNHQTELDPQAISLLLEKSHPRLAEEMIFVAGHRVISDPLAVPFSKGRNLLCIYSKNYIERPPEEKHKKVLHNRRTMKKMRDLLSEGGKCIYVAPSGGRDRPNKEGKVEVAPFDAQSIEMFRLVAEQAEHHTRFYPLALATFDLLPPPNNVQVSMGESRQASCTPIHMSVGAEITMHSIPGIEHAHKDQIRNRRAEYIWNRVREGYQNIRGQR